jgi:NAD(P)-dependent dehydrogenase (short-subunit alcohol dehydrogenase family)
VAIRHEVLTLEDFRFLFLTPSPASQAAGEEFWERCHQRFIDVDPPTSKQTAGSGSCDRRVEASARCALANLRTITQPTVVINGHRDITWPSTSPAPSSSSTRLRSWLTVQYPELFVATKATLASMTRSWVAEFSPSGVRVNAIAAGPVLTAGAAPERINALGAATLLARPAQPGEIAEVIAFLASPMASYVTDAVFAAGGGRTAI